MNQKNGKYRLESGDQVVTSRGLRTVVVQKYPSMEGMPDPWSTLHGIMVDEDDCRVIIKAIRRYTLRTLH